MNATDLISNLTSRFIDEVTKIVDAKDAEIETLRAKVEAHHGPDAMWQDTGFANLEECVICGDTRPESFDPLADSGALPPTSDEFEEWKRSQ